MLSPSQLSTLSAIISDDSKSFEANAEKFQKSFEKIDQFKAGLSLWFILKENLLSLNQRLVSFFLLYDLYRQEEVPTTPFIPLMLESLEETKNRIERKFLTCLIEFTFTDAKTIVREYVEKERRKIGEEKEGEEEEAPDMEQYWKMHQTTKEKCSSQIKDWIRPVLYDNYSNNIISKKSPENIPNFDIGTLTPEEISYENFEPNFLTYYPNSSYPFYEDEPMWILPTMKYDFLWDFTMAPIQDTVKNLLNKPMINKDLTEEQTHYLLEIIEENPYVLKEINFSPDNMMNLIEKNDKLAYSILSILATNKGFEEFLQPFLENKCTINSIKVMNMLIQRIDFPENLLCAYIKNLIANSNNTKDKIEKNRLISLTAFFVNNLTANGHIRISKIPKEISSILNENFADNDVEMLKKKLEENRE